MAGVHALAFIRRPSRQTSLRETAILAAELIFNPALYEPSCDYACVQALLSHVSSHLVLDKKSDA